MKIVLLVVGKTTDRHIEALTADYAGRINHYVPFQMVVVPELRNTRSLTPQQQKQQKAHRKAHGRIAPVQRLFQRDRQQHGAAHEAQNAEPDGLGRHDDERDGGDDKAAEIQQQAPA